MSPRNLLVVLYVHDMARAVAFYRDGIGLEVATESPGWSALRCGDASIGLHRVYSAAGEQPVPYAGLNLEVDDLDAAIAQAVEHGATLTEIREPEPHVPVRLGVLVDPEGNGFELRRQLG